MAPRNYRLHVGSSVTLSGTQPTLGQARRPDRRPRATDTQPPSRRPRACDAPNGAPPLVLGPTRPPAYVGCASTSGLGSTRSTVLLLVLASAVLSAGVQATRGQTTCVDPFVWADTNYFSDTTVTGFNDYHAIASGTSVAVGTPDMLAAVVDKVCGSSTWSEQGALFHIENDPANPDDARTFDVRALVRYVNPGATLKVQIRSAPPPGMDHGENVNQEVPVFMNRSFPFNPQPTRQDYYWAQADIDLGAANELPTGDYYFCVFEQRQPGAQYDFYYMVAVDLITQDGGFVTPWFGGPNTWYNFGYDPMIVIRRCDPTPDNMPPVAIGKVTSQMPARVHTQVQFDGSGSYDPEHLLLTYDWYFGDETPHSNQMSPTHSYNAAGVYWATLTVNDGVFPDTIDFPIRVTVVANPPSISQIQINRLTGPNAPAPTIGVHEGDDDTRVRFIPTVTDHNGNACGGNCGYLWSDDLDEFDPGLADDESPQGTLEDLGLSTVGLHTITLTVTDNGIPPPDNTASLSVNFWVSPLPTVSFEFAPEVWERLDWHYHFGINVTLNVNALGLTNAGRAEMTDSNGVPIPGETPVYLDSLYDDDLDPNGQYPIQGLVRHDYEVWDLGNCNYMPVYVAGWGRRLGVQAVGLIDTNGYHLPQLPPDPPFTHLKSINLPPGKDKTFHAACDRQAQAFAAFAAATAAGMAAALLWWCPPAAAAAAIAAAAFTVTGMFCQGEHDRLCRDAHQDPIIPDIAYAVPVSMSLEYPALSSACPFDAGPTALLHAAESGAVLNNARAAYNAAADKLAGVYLLCDPNDPNWSWYAALQGSSVVRYGQIVADALTRSRDAWALAPGALPLTAEDIAAAQAAVAASGWPVPVLVELQQLGADVGALTTAFLEASPTQLAQRWAEGPSDAYDVLANLYMSQSEFLAPSGLVLVGITQPYNGAGVAGQITIDARVVHKKEFYDHCACGDTVVTEVILDQGLPQQQTIAQAPIPLPNCDGLHAAPSAVPVVGFDTGTLPEGPHTITVVARDGCAPQPLVHLNIDTITIIVDRTPPTILITSPDVDPNTPGIQIYAGDRITYAAADAGSGLIGPAVGELGTVGGAYTQTICVADRVGNTATADVDVIRPQLDNGVVRATFTDYGSSGDRLSNESGYLAWLPISDSTQAYTWEGNLHYDDGQGPANHRLPDASEFTVTYALHRVDAEIESWLENEEFSVVATHALDGATLTTRLQITNKSGRTLGPVHFAWMLDGDLVRPDADPCCDRYTWLGFGTGRWFAGEGRGLQTDLNQCAGLVPADIAVTHGARIDGVAVPGQWTVSNASGFQGSTCDFDGTALGQPRYLFEMPFDNTAGCAGFDQDLGIVTDFEIVAWPDQATHTFVYTLTFQRPGDTDGDDELGPADFAAWADCLTGPGIALDSLDCALLDFLCDDDVDLADFALFQAAFAGGK
jgi:PKD repeat protein